MKLTVVLCNTYRTYIAINYENDHLPYGRRTVQITLTPEQEKQLERREVGKASGKPMLEEYGDCWLENDDGSLL